ncbi:ABC transporter permease [Sulfitobacter guttiformis]|uniref:Putative hydroxymethylpyrimidine transport system permease protein n=1 Tax=Sulfitobacter guttiformis TaxID=74349 RepID=A0A420DQF3_9RHOB|nr:ABC transporter permease subunit [Sulfitobacter guttiformis]KIN73912.1 ABC transporter, permease protein [Sulfitobacter guttiformis KCTC 32187]RKE96544.1 putative hydroxymethylpyrimidine transport system permease protein [Sulfitobacter guttiformis]
MRRLSRAASALIFAVILWQAVILVTDVPRFILPGPALVGQALWENGALIRENALWSAGNLALGLGIGIILGIETALLLALSRRARWLVHPLLVAAQAVPIFALAPVITLWLGYGMPSKIVTIALVTYFPIASAMFDRLMALPSGLVDLSRLSGADRWRETLLLRLPYAVPGLLSGLRLAIVYAPLAVLIGEWVGSSQGLGHLILMSNGRGQTALMFAALIVLSCLSLCLWLAVEALSRLATKWL